MSNPQKPKAAKNIAIALSGGGGGGCALHLGIRSILQPFFEQTDRNISFISGSSAGGIIGAEWALNPTEASRQFITEKFLSLNQADVFGRFSSQIRFLRIAYAVLENLFRVKNKKINGAFWAQPYKDFLHSIYGNNSFSNLTIPAEVVAAEIISKDKFICRSGYLDIAAFATSAQVPELEPYDLNGKLLNDGGIIMVAPAELCLQKPVDEVWAIVVTQAAAQKKPRGVLEVLESTTYTAVADNLRRSKEALKFNGEGQAVDGYWLEAIDFPPLDNFLDFFPRKQELFDYGKRKAQEFLADLQPVQLKRL